MWNIDVKVGSRPFIKHSHSRFEITVVNRGEGEYTTENAVYPMKTGDIFVFSSNEVHCITNSSGEGLNITNLHFEPRYLSLEDSNTSFIGFCFSHSKDFSNRIPAKIGETLRFCHKMIEQEFLTGDSVHPVAIRSYLNLMLIELQRNHRYLPENETKGCTVDMLAVYDYIEQHFCEEITLKSLSSIVHLSPNYFSCLFKELNGITLWDYITAKRIEKAARLIVSDAENGTVLQIATKCGFNNTANFNKAFKKQKGFTPSELRRKPELLWH